jgi:hypothetical protein
MYHIECKNHKFGVTMNRYKLFYLKLSIFGLLTIIAPAFASADLKPDLKTYSEQIKPLVQKYCIRCHGNKKSEGEIRLDNIDPNIIIGESFGKWEDIREAFNTGEMPPEHEPQPSTTERDTITRWLDAEFKKAKLYGNPNKRGKVRRLTRYELQYALEDLLNVSVKEEVNSLPEEGTSLETGLKNSSRLLMISGPHLEAYLNVILSVINKMKAIAKYEPYYERVDIENLDTNPPPIIASNGKKHKPLVGKVDRSGKGAVINPGGYMDLKISVISRWMFQTSLKLKSESPGKIQVSIGFTHSEVDPRQKFAVLGDINFQANEELKTYSLNSYPETLPAEMTRAIDRPFFVRITNRGKQKLYLERFDYIGNLNTELTASLIPTALKESEVSNHVRESILNFIEKAFRRSPSKAEFEKYYGIYQESVKDNSPLVALLDAYKEILCSPSFFYIGLSGNLSEAEKRNYKLAEKLSFFLWCSVPDRALLETAASGALATPEVLSSEVKRMIDDEKTLRWVKQFTDQWLQTAMLFNVAVDNNYYPRFKEPLKELMHQETIESMNDVFRNGSPALDLLSADHIFVNQTLAAFYKINGVKGEEFRKVQIEEKNNRGGLLTQGTFLVGNSDGMNSHAILRGVWLAEVILHDPPPDPPKKVPPLDESIPGFDKMTLNQKLFAHRNNAACKNCHQKIDPWGIPFENYDASGAWREKVLIVSKSKTPSTKRKKPVFEKSFIEIDRKSTLQDGTSFDGMKELKQYLINHRRHDFSLGLTKRILAYALSRDIDFHDEELVDRLCNHFEKHNYSVPFLIREIVQSEPFKLGD